jgi:hypothetical protein
MTRCEIEKSETLWFNKPSGTQWYDPSPCTFQGWVDKRFAFIQYPRSFIGARVLRENLYPTEEALKRAFVHKAKEDLKKHREAVKRAAERAKVREGRLKGVLASVKTHEAMEAYRQQNKVGNG